ncbi:MAG TPA: Gfo/Idh/MocA family oxidoreductase [Ktedonobacterales bacterium]|jgi:predicted dehydrogenase
MAAKIRVGVIGVNFGGTHIPAFQAHDAYQVVAIAASHQERAQEAAHRFGIPRAVAGYEHLVEREDVDLVSVASAPQQHSPMVMAALKHGKHALVEVAFTRNLHEAETLTAAAERSGKIGAVDFELRFQAARRYATELVREGYLGQMYLARADVLIGMLADPHGFPYKWLSQRKAGGGMLAGFGSHYLDALRLWCGEIADVDARLGVMVPERFSPQAGHMVPVDADDTAVVTLGFASGALGVVTVSGVTRAGESRVELYGSKGTLVLKGFSGELWGAKAGEQALSKLEIPENYIAALRGKPGQQGMIVALLDELAAAIHAGHPAEGSLLPTFADALAVQRVLEAAQHSSEEGRRVRL